MKAVQDVQCLGAVAFDQLQIGLPHIGAHELDARGDVFADEGEEALKALDGALLTDPQQPRALRVNLIDQCQVLVPASILDLVHANRPQRAQGAMGQAPLDHVLHRMTHRVPAGVE